MHKGMMRFLLAISLVGAGSLAVVSVIITGTMTHEVPRFAK
jgi:hypothetical protein